MHTNPAVSLRKQKQTLMENIKHVNENKLNGYKKTNIGKKQIIVES